MYCFNDKSWPFVIFEFKGLQTLEQHECSLEEWDLQFLHAEPFIAIRLFHDEDALIHPQGAAQLTKIWLRNGAAELIKTWVLAMINIVPDTAYEQMKHMSVEAVFGVPGGIFKKWDDVLHWCQANNIGAAAGVNLDTIKRLTLHYSLQG